MEIRPKRALTGAIAALSMTVAYGTLPPTASAAKAPNPTPNAKAKAHGIKKAGDATMGWMSKGSKTPKPMSGKNPKLEKSGATTHAGTTYATATSPVAGLDISAHTQGERWATWKSNGVRFVYIKASEGNYYTNEKFSSQYIGATNAGLKRGAYHFANPSVSGGRAQADYFISKGGGWSPDGRTLPGALDMEWNPYGDMCYGKTPAQLQQFVADFVGRYKERTGTRPIIYTATIWWNKCMGASPKWTATPLWIADYRSTLGALPYAWQGASHKIWQNAAYNSAGYDTNLFNGGATALYNFARYGA